MLLDELRTEVHDIVQETGIKTIPMEKKCKKVKLGNGKPLQYSCLEYSMDRGAWRATVHGVAKSQTRLSD